MVIKREKTARKNKSALSRGIYLAVIIGIVAIVAIVTVESIIDILREAF